MGMTESRAMEMGATYPVYSTPVGGLVRVSGLFPIYSEAQRAVGQLEQIGVDGSHISLFYNDEQQTDSGGEESDGGTRAAEGAGYGSAVGGTLGAIFGAAIASIATISLPGLGILIAGPVAGALAGAGAGGLTGGVLGALTGAGIPEDTARSYEQGIASGGVVVIADVPAELVPDARAILDSFNRR